MNAEVMLETLLRVQLEEITCIGHTSVFNESRVKDMREVCFVNMTWLCLCKHHQAWCRVVQKVSQCAAQLDYTFETIHS